MQKLMLSIALGTALSFTAITSFAVQASDVKSAVKEVATLGVSVSIVDISKPDVVVIRGNDADGVVHTFTYSTTAHKLVHTDSVAITPIENTAQLTSGTELIDKTLTSATEVANGAGIDVSTLTVDASRRGALKVSYSNGTSDDCNVDGVCQSELTNVH